MKAPPSKLHFLFLLFEFPPFFARFVCFSCFKFTLSIDIPINHSRMRLLLAAVVSLLAASCYAAASASLECGGECYYNTLFHSLFSVGPWCLECLLLGLLLRISLVLVEFAI